MEASNRGWHNRGAEFYVDGGYVWTVKNHEIFSFAARVSFAVVAGCVLREDFEYERTDRGDAEEVREVVVQDRDVRSGDDKLPT